MRDDAEKNRELNGILSRVADGLFAISRALERVSQSIDESFTSAEVGEALAGLRDLPAACANHEIADAIHESMADIGRSIADAVVEAIDPVPARSKRNNITGR